MKDYSFIIHCSNCNKPLVDIWVINDDDTTTKVRATCPHCGDKSYWKDVKGKFTVGYTDETDLGKFDYTESSLEIICHKK